MQCTNLQANAHTPATTESAALLPWPLTSLTFLPATQSTVYFTDPAYRRTEQQGFQSRLRVDLIASCIRQRDMIANVFNAYIFDLLPRGVRRYAAFLLLLELQQRGGKSATMLVPTYDIDLCWHAHMMATREYYAVTRAGPDGEGLVNHDDSFPDRSRGYA